MTRRLEYEAMVERESRIDRGSSRATIQNELAAKTEGPPNSAASACDSSEALRGKRVGDWGEAIELEEVSRNGRAGFQN